MWKEVQILSTILAQNIRRVLLWKTFWQQTKSIDVILKISFQNHWESKKKYHFGFILAKIKDLSYSLWMKIIKEIRVGPKLAEICISNAHSIFCFMSDWLYARKDFSEFSIFATTLLFLLLHQLCKKMQNW